MTEIDATAFPVQSPDKAALYARFSYDTNAWTCNAYQDGRLLTSFDMHGSAYDPTQVGMVNPALNQARLTTLDRLPGWNTSGPWTTTPQPSDTREIEYRVALTAPTLTSRLMVNPRHLTDYVVSLVNQMQQAPVPHRSR